MTGRDYRRYLSLYKCHFIIESICFMILQSYLHKEGAPQYSDTGERLSKNMKTGFEQQRREAGLARDEL